MMSKEIRYLQLDEIEKRTDDDVVSYSGYIVKFDTRSHFLGFYESVDKRAFDKTLEENDNIFMLYNHDFDQVLGSTDNNSLKLWVDDTGLRFELTPKADTTYMRDVRELIESGELKGCSFGFSVVDDEWTEKDDHAYRTLKEVKLIETTLTPVPAYGSSEVSKRSYEAFKAEQEELELLNVRLMLNKMERGMFNG